MSKPVPYVFKLSKATEFHGGIAEVITWIKQKKREEGYYHFRSHTPKYLRVGSPVLFEIEGKIIGQGIVKEGVKSTPPERLHQGDHDYPYFVTFEPSTLEIFKEYPHEIDVSRVTGKRFGRPFQPLEWQDYLLILKMARKKVNTIKIEEEFKEKAKFFSKEDIRALIASRDEVNRNQNVEWSNSTSKRYYRDPLLALYLKYLYEDACQIKGCKNKIKVEYGYFTDTHHIIPRRDKGDDMSPNILVLCPNHHRLFHRAHVQNVRKEDDEIVIEIGGKEIRANTSVRKK